MDSAFKEPRVSAKNFKTEALLCSIEQGSIEHIYQLPRDWPTNPHDGAIALQTIFTLLEKEAMPQPTKRCTSQCHHDNRTVTRIRYSMDVIMTAMGELENKNRKVQENFAQVFQDNVPTLVRWLRFLAEESRWAYPDQESPESFGPMAMGETLQKIYHGGSRELMGAINASFEALDFLLYLWTWRDAQGKTLTWRYSSDGYRCPIATLFPFMVTKVPGTTDNLTTVFSGRTYRQNRLFIDSSLARLEEWTSLALQGKLESLAFYTLETIALTQQFEFLEVPSYAKAYIKAKFPARALALAMQLPDLKVPPTYGSATLPIAVSVKFFPNDPADTAVHLVHKIVPDLIKVGLLQVLVDHLLSQPAGTPHPWYAWVKEEPMGHPLQMLASMCIHQPICSAVREFSAKIPVSTMSRLVSAHYVNHWKPFYESFLLYEAIWQRWYLSGWRMPLCDNLNHHKRAQATSTEDSRECSACQTVIYCSAACQKEDWEAFHKSECPRNRAYRIGAYSSISDFKPHADPRPVPVDRVLDSAWVGHRDRAYLLTFLQHMVLNYEVGFSAVRQVNIPEPSMKFSTAMEYEHGPICDHHHQGHIAQTNTLILHYNSLFCPPQPFRHALDGVLGYAHEGVPTFRNPRFMAMFDDFVKSVKEDDAKNRGKFPQRRMKVALLSAFCGVYRIYAVGRFEVVKNVRKTSVALVNGFIKIEERRKLDEETSMIPVFH